MRALNYSILMLGLLAPMAAGATEAAKAAAPAAAPSEAMAGRQAWGDKLPEALSISMWAGGEGEAKATKISSSREVFACSFEIGKEGKAGFKAAVAGRVLPRGDGSYELLLYVDMAGLDASKGGISLKLQNSVVLKKGNSVLVAGNKDHQLFIRID